jgi:hypothetical protein
MRLSCLHEGWANVALDAVGLIPGLEAADAASAMLHIKNGEYFSAAMSIFAMVPAVGDAIGKSAKYLGKNSPKVAAFLARYSDDIIKYWPQVLRAVKSSKQFAKYAPQLDAAVKSTISAPVNKQ